MIRDVDLVSYLPPFMQTYKEPVAALEAENPEFSLMWSATDKCLNNRFIETADDYGLSRFEKMLGITADSTESLETRRMRVRNRWFNKLPYTIRTLTEKVKQIVGESYNFTISGNLKDYELDLTVYTLNDSQNKELEYLLSVIVPLNMITNIVYENALEGNVRFGGVLQESNIITIRQV